MAWPSPPFAFNCPACGWKYCTPGQVSDCRLPGLNHFSACPRCGEPVTSRLARPWDVLLSHLWQAMHKPG